MRIVVADQYQLARLNNEFTKEHKTLLRKGMKVTDEWVNQNNDNFKDSGLLFIVDEKATDAYYATGQRQLQVKAEIKEIEAAKAANTLTNVLTEVVEKKTRKHKTE